MKKHLPFALFFSLMVIRCYTVAEKEPIRANSTELKPVCKKYLPTADTTGYRAFPGGLIRPNGDTAYKKGKMYVYP